MLRLHPFDAASTATSQLDRNRRQFRTANTFHAGWSRPAVPASVSRFSSCCRAPRRLCAEGTTRSLRCGGAEDGHPSQDSSTASPSRPGSTPTPSGTPRPRLVGRYFRQLTCHNRLKAPHYTARRGSNGPPTIAHSRGGGLDVIYHQQTEGNQHKLGSCLVEFFSRPPSAGRRLRFRPTCMKTGLELI